MKWTGLNELREKYLSFFESKQHMRLSSFPLIPRNDKSLLLINSGMAPMKKYFTGEITPPAKRVTTCQKCIRTPDIERVGITARHGTYFEMLGNFSFGDYFKTEVTQWAWEFCTEVLELPVDKIWVSIYEEDDESFDIWVNNVGVSTDRIVRLGKEDNFWEHGAGPCGPCSELYFDRGEKYGCGSPDCRVGCECDRFVEFWNLVFTQFESDGKGNYTPLEHPNIDTGMGLERLACIMQDVDNLFLVDTVQNTMKHVIEIANVEYGKDPKTDISLRVITDHIRSTTFMIADGVKASNEGRGYVLRRLLRRAARHGRLLGINRLFLSEVCETVIKENKDAYPELEEKKDLIKKLIAVEEESFAKTIDQGLSILNTMIKNAQTNVLSGEDAFKINDTFGFPLDLTKEILAERGMTLDEAAFIELMKQQKERARNARKNAGADAWIGNTTGLESIEATDFVGYDSEQIQAKVIAIVDENGQVDSANESDEVLIVLDRTTFYAESGGQIGDAGIITADGLLVEVSDTTKNHSGVVIHTAKIINGEVQVGDVVTAKVDDERRLKIKRNHTAAHLLQAALRKVLGTHVEQAGQLVSEGTVRFDFTHFSAMTHEEIEQVEALVNAEIFKGLDLNVQEMSIDDARKKGAMALFGEKYGNTVRVVEIPDFSIELCGGTHIENTAKIGLFKIISESSVAAGVRRIEGVTATGVLNLINRTMDTINQAAAALKLTNSNDLVRKAMQTVSELKNREKTIDVLNGKLASIQVENLLVNAQKIGDIKLITSILKGADADSLRTMTDKMRDMVDNVVAIVATINGDKITIATAVGKQAQKKGAHAGNIVREIAKLAGGNGGGRPDSAMAGAKDVNKLDEAMKQAVSIVENMLKD